MSETPDPTRVVADADVLAADLLVGGNARAALDHLRRHSWTTLVASDALLDDTETVVAALATAELATAHRDRLEAWTERVDHPTGDHPGLASAYRGGAPHLLSFDPDLTSVGAGASLKPHVDVSVRTPDAFARLFNPERLWPEVGDGPYPGPDRDPRA
jgi:predicted nucleic acid-binding protein